MGQGRLSDNEWDEQHRICVIQSRYDFDRSCITMAYQETAPAQVIKSRFGSRGVVEFGLGNNFSRRCVVAQKWGNPEVREWMKTHKDEVEKIQARYDELRGQDIETLVRLAQSDGADLTKVRAKLIAAIIAVEGTRL